MGTGGLQVDEEKLTKFELHRVLVFSFRLFLIVPHAAPTYILDPRGSGLLFFMFLRAQPYTCLGIELP